MADEREMSAREQAIKAINEGGSVIINNVQYRKDNLADLPNDAEFAMITGNPQAEADALAKIQAQIQALQQAEQMLTTRSSNVTQPVVTADEAKKAPAKETTSK